MMAAAELAAIRLKDVSYSKSKGLKGEHRDGMFSLLDKNGDGRISIEELIEVMEELGAPGEDAEEMMQLLDSNNDGSLSCDEFENFQKQVEFMRKWEERDKEYRSILDEKLLQVAQRHDGGDDVEDDNDESSGLIQLYSRELGDTPLL